ncbi:MAG: hypothetical protein ACYTFG_05285 [Planctomycetota bacterium]|jgi:hypothetical protein
MIRLILTIPASIALFLTPLVTLCQHGGEGHVEILGRCHDDGVTEVSTPTDSHCGHGCHGKHHGPSSDRSSTSMESPHLHHESLGGSDLLRIEWRSGFDPLRSLVAAQAETGTEFRLSACPGEFRSREPPPGPPLILLTETLLL